MNVSKVIKRDKRRNKNEENDLERSMWNPNEIPPIESIIIHQTDKIIKPIIGNKIIEIVPPTTFNKNKLPSQAWKIEKIREFYKSNNTKMIENYLLMIYSTMEQSSAKGDDENLLNILNYFETIIQDKDIANNIINTSFMTMFISIMQRSRNDNIKVRVCSIIAYLIRYSTVMETPLDQLGLTKALDTLVRDKSPEVNRKAIATLGEYLFFVATQAEGEEESSIYWKVSEESLKTLLYALEINRDDIVKFYAIKSIENISALTQIAKVYFAQNPNFLEKLVEIFNKSRNQEIRMSAIYSISHLIRLEPNFLKNFLEKKNFNELMNNMEQENSKIQQALINCILFGVYGNNQIILMINNFDAFMHFLIMLLDSCSVVVKMKIILIFAILMEYTYTICFGAENFLEKINRLKKENSNEVYYAVKIFELCLIKTIDPLIKNFISILNKFFIKSSSRSKNMMDYLEELNTSLKAFSSIGSYSKTTSHLYTKELLESLMSIVQSADKFNEVILKNVFNNIRNFSESSLAVTKNSDFVIKNMFIQVIKSTF